MQAVVYANRMTEAADTTATLLREGFAPEQPQLEVQRVFALDSAAAAKPGLLIVHAEARELPLLPETLSKFRAAAPDCAILVVADGLTRESIGELFGAGAHDFAGANASTAELLGRVQHALERYRKRPAIRSITHPKLKGIVGNSPAFLKELEKLPVFAGCDAGLLILGETGTGKEIFAQAVHYSSARASRPWVAVNCGAIPSELVENELFGHVRGAFTGAHASQSGLVREAEGGTLFLDEIDSLQYGAQAKLLHFLQTKDYRPVGSSTTERADVRIIAASNQQLEAQVEAGKFRRDLFYRLNVLTLTLPPLRERREDIPALALHFMRQFAAEHGRKITALEPRALAKLLETTWPGNVRELQHVIERAVLMTQGVMLTLADIDQRGEMPESPESFHASKQRVVANFERSYLENLLHANSGNIASAARAAKKNRRALFELIRKHNIDPGRFRADVPR